MHYKNERYTAYLWRRFGQQATAVTATIIICLLAGIAS